jgi:hypothetical protein
VKLYVREACHLCSDAVEMLGYAGLLPVEMIDIDDSPHLGARYGLRIPVLQLADGVELDWPFDAEQLATLTAS